MRKTTSTLIFIAVFVLSFCSSSSTECLKGADRSELSRALTNPALDIDKQLFPAVYHHFLGDQMSDVYGFAVGSYGTAGEFSAEPGGEPSRIGARLGSGLFWLWGDAIIPDSEWTVEKAELKTLVIPIDLTVMYTLTPWDDEAFFIPYIGMGCGGILGFERLDASVTENGSYFYDWHHLDFRKVFTAHAMIGTYLWAGKKYKGLLEIRYTYSGVSSQKKNEELDQAMIDAGWSEEVFTTVDKPDFNFSGLSVSLGIEF